MVLRIETLQRRLYRLEQVITGLQRLGALDRVTLRESYFEMLALERLLEIGAAIIFDLGNHILSAEYGVSVDDYEDIVVQLARYRVISEDLRSRLRGIGGFRNLLVHGYIDIEAERVLDLLPQAPHDFSDFARQIEAWLKTRP